MTRKLQVGDRVLYKSRKNGGKYIGFFSRYWVDRFGRTCATIHASRDNNTQEIANPFIDDVQLLTDELHMLYKLENS